MKKSLSVIMAIIIALSVFQIGITAFAKTPGVNQTTHISAQVSASAKKKKVSAKKMKKAYKAKVDGIIKKYGKSRVDVALYDLDTYESLAYCTVGLSFLKLIDMNGDGIKEMIVVYAVPLSECGIEGVVVEYKLEVYTFNGKKAIKAGGYTVKEVNEGICPTVRIVNVSKKEKCLYVLGSSGTGDYYVLKGKKIKKITTGFIGYSRSINGKKVSADAYFKNKYVNACIEKERVTEYPLSGISKKEAKKLVKQNNKAYNSLK